MTKVFVYGSLVTGSRYHEYYLQGKTFLGKGCVKGYKKYVLGGLDGARPEQGQCLQGALYEVDSTTLAKLDFLHSHNPLFEIKLVDVELENGEILQAKTYIWNGSVNC